MSTNAKLLTVFFDGGCMICSREIDHYKNRTYSHRIKFVDITQPGFDAQEYGVDPDEIHRVFHVQKSDGTFVTGVPAFAEIWHVLEIFKPLSYFVSTWIGRAVMNLGYQGFVVIRPWLPRKECTTTSCDIPPSARPKKTVNER